MIMIKNNWIIKLILIGLCCVSGTNNGSCPGPCITPELPHSITTGSLPTNYELTPSVMLEQLLKENAVCRESVIRIESILIGIKEELASHNSILSSIQSSIQSIASYMALWFLRITDVLIKIRNSGAHSAILSRENNRENNATKNNHQQGNSAIPERIDARLTDLNSWFNFFRKGYNTSRLP